MKAILVALALTVMPMTAFARGPGPPPRRMPVVTGHLVSAFFKPAHARGRLPAMIVLGGSEGGMNAGVTREAKILAQDGYASLQLAYFGTAGLPEALQLIPLEYFKTAIDWLRARPDVDPDRIGIEGTSIGGEVALVVAAHYPEIKAVIAAVPSSVVWPGITRVTNRPPSTFTLSGRPLPDLPYGWIGALHVTDARYVVGLRAVARHPDAVIPVEAINSPVMLICGQRDRAWPSCPMSAQVVARLRAAGFRFPVRLLNYADAGHAVFGPPVSPRSPDFADLGLLGGTAAANNAARADSWPKSVAFLDAALKPGK